MAIDLDFDLPTGSVNTDDLEPATRRLTPEEFGNLLPPTRQPANPLPTPDDFSALLASPAPVEQGSPTGVIPAIGTGLAYVGNIAKGFEQDVSRDFQGLDAQGRPRAAGSYPVDQTQPLPEFMPNIRSALRGEPETPYDKFTKEVTGLPGIAKGVSEGVSEMVPKIAIAGGLGRLAEGVVAPIAAHALASAAVFGTTEQGFDPKQAAIMGSFPLVSKLGGAAMESALGKLGVDLSSDLAKQAAQSTGGFLASQAYVDLTSLPDYIKMSPQERADAWAKNFGLNLAFHIGEIGKIGDAHQRDRDVFLNPPVDPAEWNAKFQQYALKREANYNPADQQQGVKYTGSLVRYPGQQDSSTGSLRPRAAAPAEEAVPLPPSPIRPVAESPRVPPFVPKVEELALPPSPIVPTEQPPRVPPFTPKLGGAQGDQTPQREAQSIANNGPAAWAEFAKKVEEQKTAPPAPAEAAPPVVETPPVAQAPLEPVAPIQAPEPIKPGTRLPNKGERISLGTDYYVTRDLRGKITVRKEGNDHTLATLKGSNPEAITKEQVLADMQRQVAGQKTKSWLFDTKSKNNPLLSTGLFEVGKETAHGDPDKLYEDIKGSLKLAPEDQAALAALNAGALPPELLGRLVGEVVMKQGAKPIAKELRSQVKKAAPQYLAGKLKERTKSGQQGKIPPELLDEEGEMKTPTELAMLYPDKKDLYARVLQILAGNKKVQLDIDDAHKNKAAGAGIENRPDFALDEGPNAIAPVNKSGFADEDILTKFDDKMLTTGGKIDKVKVALAERANEIKEALLRGEEADYEQGVKNLVALGLPQLEAERWMDSGSNFYAPGDSKAGNITGGLIRPAQTEFSNPYEKSLYDAHQLTTGNFIDAVQWVANNSSDPELAKFAQDLLSNNGAELAKVGAGNIGGNSLKSHFNLDTNRVKLALGMGSEVDEVVAHEAVHAVSARRLALLPDADPLKVEALRLIQVTKDFAAQQRHDLGRMSAYAITSSDELLATVLTNGEAKAYFETIRDGNQSLWQSIKNWVYKLFTGKELNSVAGSVQQLFDRLMQQPAVSNADWSAARHAESDVFNYPEIRNPAQLKELVDYKAGERPHEEELQITRKAIAQNTFLADPEIRAILAQVPEASRPLLKNIIGSRELVVSEAAKRGGVHPETTFAQVQADGAISPEHKSDIAKSTLDNILQFQRQTRNVENKLATTYEKFMKVEEDLDKGIDESNYKIVVTKNAVKILAADMKNRILREQEGAVSVERAERLSAMAKIMDRLRGGQDTAMSKYLEAVADAVPLDQLLGAHSSRDLEALIREQFPIGSETAQKTGANEETQRMASVMMVNSNVIREQLLNLKFANDEKVREAVGILDSEISTDLRAGDLNKALAKYTSQVANYGTVIGKAQALYKTALKSRSDYINKIARLAGAFNALDSIQQSKSFREFYSQVADKTAAMKEMKLRSDGGAFTFIHPITREPVVIDATFERSGRIENLKKLADLADAARNYVINTASSKYDPMEAGFWKDYLSKISFTLDPFTGLGANKLVGPGWDPYRVLDLFGSGMLLSDKTLHDIGGREAADGSVRLQALGVVRKQAEHVYEAGAATVDRLSKMAADSHKQDINIWHEEVLNPIIHSWQGNGNKPLGEGDTTIFGHEVTKEDMQAFKAQLEWDNKFAKVGATGLGHPSVQYDPARVDFESPTGERLSRKQAHTGAGTMPRHLWKWAQSLASQWFESQDFEVRKDFLDSNFGRLVMGHLNTMGDPSYSVHSNQADLYKAALKDNAKNQITTVDQLLDSMVDAQNRIRDEKRQISREKMLEQLIAETDKFMNSIQSSYAKATEKPGVSGIMHTVGADSSFTRERGNLIAPSTFYEYGLTFQENQISRVISTTFPYIMELAGRGGSYERLELALKKQMDNYERQVDRIVATGVDQGAAIKKVSKASDKAQLLGEALVTYKQAEDYYKRVVGIRRELERVFTNNTGKWDPEASNLITSGQNMVSSSVLAGPTSRVKHFDGGIVNAMLAHRVMMGRSVALSGVKYAMNALVKGSKSAMEGELSRDIGDLVQEQVDLHRRMSEQGLAPTTNVLENLKSLVALPTSGGKLKRGFQGTGSKIIGTVESASRAIAEPLRLISTAPTDRLLSWVSVSQANAIEDILRLNAVRAGDTREALGQRGFFTAPEIFGQKGAKAKQEILLRQRFSDLGLSLDTLMWNYRDGVAKAKEEGRDPNEVKFFTPEQRAAFQFLNAQENSLPVLGNRPLGFRGSKGRNAIGLFLGFHVFQSGKYRQLLQRAATDPSVAKHIPTILMTALTTAAIGAVALTQNNWLRRHLFGESPTTPGLLDGHGAKDAAVALVSGLGSYVPMIGGLINGLVLNNPNQTGFDINSQFVMLNFANDAFLNTPRKMLQEKDIVRPMEEFMRRWAPLSRIIIDRLPNQEGLTEYYNVARDLKNLAPAGMETKKRGGASFDATPATPIMQDMINAAYRGDTQKFYDTVDKFLVYQNSIGKTPQEAQQALTASFRAKNPYIMEFGRLPTRQEQAEIYATASPEQQQGLDKAASVFQSYGKLIGVNQEETKEQKGTGGGGAVFSGGGNAYSGNRVTGAFAGSLSGAGAGRGILDQSIVGGGAGGSGGILSGGPLGGGGGEGILGPSGTGVRGSRGAKGFGGGSAGGSLRSRGSGVPRSRGSSATLHLKSKGSSLRVPKLGAASGKSHKQRLSSKPYLPLKRDGTRLRRA